MQEASLNSFCIATWNIENMPLKGDRANACRDKIADIQAQVWILTEMREGFSPGEDFHLIAQSELPSDLTTDRRWTAIWAHQSLIGSSVKTGDQERTACARIESPDGFILYVYGTVLPWLGDNWRGFPSAGGKAFTEALAVQKADWSDLLTNHPEASLCVAGDFNQDLLDSWHFYGSKIQRKALMECLEQTHLKCLTGGKMDPVERINPARANIDHICLGGLAPQTLDPVHVNAWSPEQQGLTLSDHFGVSAEFSYS